MAIIQMKHRRTDQPHGALSCHTADPSMLSRFNKLSANSRYFPNHEPIANDKRVVEMKFLNKQLPAIRRCVVVAGVTVLWLDPFGLSWPFESIIAAVLMFLVFSFEQKPADADHVTKS